MIKCRSGKPTRSKSGMCAKKDGRSRKKSASKKSSPKKRSSTKTKPRSPKPKPKTSKPRTRKPRSPKPKPKTSKPRTRKPRSPKPKPKTSKPRTRKPRSPKNPVDIVLSPESLAKEMEKVRKVLNKELGRQIFIIKSRGDKSFNIDNVITDNVFSKLLEPVNLDDKINELKDKVAKATNETSKKIFQRMLDKRIKQKAEQKQQLIGRSAINHLKNLLNNLFSKYLEKPNDVYKFLDSLHVKEGELYNHLKNIIENKATSLLDKSAVDKFLEHKRVTDNKLYKQLKANEMNLADYSLRDFEHLSKYTLLTDNLRRELKDIGVKVDNAKVVQVAAIFESLIGEIFEPIINSQINIITKNDIDNVIRKDKELTALLL
jgi:hypothetical protein